MSTIRERDAEIDDGSGVSVMPFVSEAEQDRRALLTAGDALATFVQAQHPVSPMRGLDGKLAMVWCDGCDAPESECWAVPVIAAWEAVAG